MFNFRFANDIYANSVLAQKAFNDAAAILEFPIDDDAAMLSILCLGTSI